jgi:hypothetical protein
MHRTDPFPDPLPFLFKAGMVAFLTAVLFACSPMSQKSSPAVASPREAQAPAAGTADLEAYETALEEVIRLEKEKEHEDAREIVLRQLRRDDFDALPGDMQYKWLHLAGLLDIEARAFEDAHAEFKRTSQMPMATEDDWGYRFVSAQMSGDRADAMLALTTAARRWPAKVRAFNPRLINRLVSPRGDGSKDDDARFQLLDALYAAEWKLDYGFEPSQAWADFARLLLERGDLERAVAVSSRITSPRALLALRVDKRFDAVVRAAPQRFDVDAAAAREIGVLERLSADSPRQLALKYELIFACMDAAQFERALRLADAVLADASPEKAYDDYEDQINWILDARANTLRSLGKWREARRYLEQAAAHLEDGHPNVSNTINLAMLHAEFGRSREALSTLGAMAFETEGVSPYGGMQIHHVMLLAAVASHDATGVKDALEFMRENQSSTYSTFQRALLSANELDEAAALMIRRLQDPALRSAALSEMQSYRNGALSPADRTAQQRWEQLKARSDVRAAVAEVGRVEKFSLAAEMF